MFALSAGAVVCAWFVAGLIEMPLVGLALGALGIAGSVVLIAPRPSRAGQSPATAWIRGRRRVWRIWSGLAVFDPGQPARRRCRAGKKALGKPRWVPDWLGDVRLVPVKPTAQDDPVAVLLQRGVGRNGQWSATVVLEVSSSSGGTDAEYAKFSKFKSALARDDSLVGVIQQVEWVGPASLTLHHRWLNERRAALLAENEVLRAQQAEATGVPLADVPDVIAATPRLVIDSYTDLLSKAEQVGEQHRSLLVLRMPFSGVYDQRTKDVFGVINSENRAKIALMETQRAVTLAMAYGGYRSATPLSEERLAAFVQVIQDPAADLEQASPMPARAEPAEHRSHDDEPSSTAHVPGDVQGGGSGGDQLSLRNCWLPYDGRAVKHVVGVGVHGQKVFRRTARIEGVSLPSQPVPVDRFATLVVGVYPAVTRTLSVVEELVPARVARQRAKEDQTMDRARAKKVSGRVTDGSETEQMTASQQRLADLSAGHGHQGVAFAFYLSVTATSEVALTQAVQGVETVANEIAQLTWLDQEHDLAQAAIFPFARGIAIARVK